jgi:TnsA-like endonuclease N terminal
MARRQRRMTGDDLPKLLAEGRGRGEGKDYEPFVKAQDFSSYGQTNRDFGETTGRQHDYFSKIEHQYHLILDHSNLLDIQEQFPLLPLEKTVDIANQCGIRHPVDFKTKRPKIMTVDFRISVPIPIGKKVIFRSVKPSLKLMEIRVGEILELERRFMESSDEDWGIVTERELNPVLVENLIWTYKFRRPSSLPHLVGRDDLQGLQCIN